MVEPHNIRRLKAVEQTLFERAEARRAADLTAVQAGWFERESLKKANPRELEREERSMDADLRTAHEQLVRARRERLRELYTAEMATWTKELAARGLAVETRLA